MDAVEVWIEEYVVELLTTERNVTTFLERVFVLM